jgi:DNA-directed RNA polymerase subunit E"
MAKSACNICKRIVTGKECPICKTSDLTRNFQGTIAIFDAENSKVAKKLGITANGKYAIKI